MGEAIYLKRGDTVEDMCKSIHKDLLRNFSYAEVWGRSCKQLRQRVGLGHVLADGDVVQISQK